MVKIFGIFASLLLLVSTQVLAVKQINISARAGDMTPVLRAAIESIDEPDVKIVFEKGVYTFMPDYAIEKYCYITNHNNGLKKIVFPFEDLQSVEIEGGGSEFIFHGQVMPFLFSNCKKVEVNNLSIDWDISFTFQGEVLAVNEEEAWYDLQPNREGFSWKLKDGALTFPNIDGFHFSKLASTLEFQTNPKRVAHGALDYYTNPTLIEEKADGVLRFHGKVRQFPTVGNVLHYKGPMAENRYAPSFQVIASKNIRMNQVVVHHALGMGFLFEKSENASLQNCGVYLKEGTPRVVSIIADATHFCNCKGDILIENCRFENMLDDGTNVHGTYVEVDEVIDEFTLRYELKHFQQMGFDFAQTNDELWIIQKPSMARGIVNQVASVKYINSKYSEITFKSELPADLAKGDLLESKTWNPTFTMRGCTIQNHRARGIVLKTPLKTVIEDNYFSSMMSAIFLRGETYFWFESGAVADVLIQNNEFSHCAYGGMQHAILYVTPRFGKDFTKEEGFDSNIRFVNNKIETFDSRIIWADRVDGLVIEGNEISKTNHATSLYPEAPVIDLKNCSNVQLIKNTYKGKSANTIQMDEFTKKSVKIKGNSGL